MSKPVIISERTYRMIETIERMGGGTGRDAALAVGAHEKSGTATLMTAHNRGLMTIEYTYPIKFTVVPGWRTMVCTIKASPPRKPAAPQPIRHTTPARPISSVWVLAEVC
ncbi:hypothetical protein [Aquabacterium sp.]|uniref:hypothetical protein n=1 Tax=Aquabacterium sp. TaxID=1872578 RepID=UPI0035AFF2AE